MSPKRGVGIAMFLVGASYFYRAHVGRTCFQDGEFGRIFSALSLTAFPLLVGRGVQSCELKKKFRFFEILFAAGMGKMVGFAVPPGRPC